MSEALVPLGYLHPRVPEAKKHSVTGVATA